MKTIPGLRRAAVLALALLSPLALAGPNGRPDSLNVGIVTFMSGPGATMFGGPSYNAAKIFIDEINKQGGIGGVPIKPTYIDEAQGSQGVLTQVRGFASEGADRILVAAVSSTNCLALSPVTSELRLPMVSWMCDTNQLFEKPNPYVFRAMSNVVPEFLSIVADFARRHPDAKRIALINPDYSMGHDAADAEEKALKYFLPDAKIVVSLFPKLFAPTFLTEISRLQQVKPDAIFADFWGGDLQKFVDQSITRGLLNSKHKPTFVIPMIDTILQSLGDKVPEGVVGGLMGTGYFLSPDAKVNPKAQKFIRDYKQAYGEYPVFSSFNMTTGILAVKAAYEKAIKRNDGKWPTKDQVKDALGGLTFETLSGPMTIRDDHEALVDQVVGVTSADSAYSFRVLGNLTRYPGKLFTAKAGDGLSDWIKGAPSAAEMMGQLPALGSYTKPVSGQQ